MPLVTTSSRQVPAGRTNLTKNAQMPPTCYRNRAERKTGKQRDLRVLHRQSSRCQAGVSESCLRDKRGHRRSNQNLTWWILLWENRWRLGSSSFSHFSACHAPMPSLHPVSDKLYPRHKFSAQEHTPHLSLASSFHRSKQLVAGRLPLTTLLKPPVVSNGDH